ncbi:MAG TPA: hypothetical protein VFX76_03575, partial [Roseiflexaceae bacterium]|nr:hypothetical protein [Roseiflexaceae bacterium]
MGDLTHARFLDAIERMEHWKPLDSYDAFVLVRPKLSGLRAEQIIRHHFVAWLPTFDDLIRDFANGFFDCPTYPGFFENLALHRSDWMLVGPNVSFGQRPVASTLFDQQKFDLIARYASIHDPADGEHRLVQMIHTGFQYEWSATVILAGRSGG